MQVRQWVTGHGYSMISCIQLTLITLCKYMLLVIQHDASFSYLLQFAKRNIPWCKSTVVTWLPCFTLSVIQHLHQENYWIFVCYWGMFSHFLCKENFIAFMRLTATFNHVLSKIHLNSLQCDVCVSISGVFRILWGGQVPKARRLRRQRRLGDGLWGGSVPSHWGGVWAGCCASPHKFFCNFWFRIGHFLLENFCIQTKGSHRPVPPPNMPQVSMQLHPVGKYHSTFLCWSDY